MVVDNLSRSIFGSEEAIHGPNERLDYRSTCWLRSQESEERTLQQCERSRPRSVATYGRGRRARTTASKACRWGEGKRAAAPCSASPWQVNALPCLRGG